MNAYEKINELIPSSDERDGIRGETHNPKFSGINFNFLTLTCRRLMAERQVCQESLCVSENLLELIHDPLSYRNQS
jgi:hypothetical protein